MAASSTVRRRTENGKHGNKLVTKEMAGVAMEKSLGLMSGVALVVGTIIGSGIFISPKGIVREVGSAGLALVVWVLCGVLALIASLSYAELGTLIQESGGEYPYLKYGYGKRLGFVIAYLYSWASITILRSSTVAILALVCSEYLMTLVYNDGCGAAPDYMIKSVAVIVIVSLTMINCYSVTWASRIQIFFTLAKLGALAIVCVGGIITLIQGKGMALDDAFTGSVWSPGPIAIAFYNGMWAYDGWNQLNIVTEELKNPEKNFPRAILIGIPLVSVIYLLVNISYFSVMSVDTLLHSPGVATTWAEIVIPKVVWIVPLSVAMSTFGSCNGSMFATGRLNFAAARDGNLVNFISYVNVSRKTPVPSIMVLCVVSICFVIPNGVDSLIDLFSFTIWLFYALTFLAQILLRFVKPYSSIKRPFKVPLILPIAAFLFSSFLVIAPIVDAPRVEFMYAGLFVLGGLILYVPFVHFKLVLPGMNSLTTYIQLLLQVAPPPNFDVMKAHRDVTEGSFNEVDGDISEADGTHNSRHVMDSSTVKLTQL